MSRYEQKGIYIFDNETKNERWDYVKILNKQDEKIKELEEEHERIKKDTIDEIFAIIDDKFNCCGYIDEISFDEFKNKIID